jgi:Tol biopolymer transport system component
MNGITHKQAKSLMHTDMDGLLTDTQRRDLDAHLRECEACRVESESLSMLTARLRSNFQVRRDTQDGPSQNVLTRVLSQKGRITMSNRIRFGLRALAGIGALIVLGFLINFAFSELRNTAAAVPGTKATISPLPAEKLPLVAFVSDQNGNSDIYSMHADGSGLTNLTNNPAHDINPFWSPDGTHIAFQSDRTGLMQIYVMNADGSNVAQLTSNEVNHELMSEHGPWSPDGTKLLFTEWGAPDAAKWKLYAIGVDGQNKTPLAEVPPVYSYPSWSPDGKHVAFVSDSRLYVVDSTGNNLTEITKWLPPGEAMDSYNPSNYYWTPDGQSIIFITSNVDSIVAKNQGGDSNEAFSWKVYQASLDNPALTLDVKTHSPIGGWWQGNYFVTPFVDVRGWTWVGSDGKVNSLDPFKNCKELSGGAYRFTTSSSGNVVIGAMCPNGDWWLHKVSPKGVMAPLMEFPIPTVQGSMERLSWSQDDKFIAFNLTSNGKTEMYLVNVIEALKDPSIKPVQVSKGSGTEINLPVWQPQP